MPLVRGNPPALLGLFFAIAVFLTGALYSVSGSARFGADPLDTLTVVALVVSLLAVLLILGRILWVAGGPSTALDGAIAKK